MRSVPLEIVEQSPGQPLIEAATVHYGQIRFETFHRTRGSWWSESALPTVRHGRESFVTGYQRRQVVWNGIPDLYEMCGPVGI